MYITIQKKQIAIVLGCFVLLLAAILKFSRQQPTAAVETLAANTNWGLGFGEKGKQPTGNASPDFLKQYNAYYVGAADKKVIYLTFDAGYEAGYTPAILDALKKHNVKATFFVVGNYLNTSPDLVKRMLAEGHIVGNHTNTHPDMSKISDMESFKKEISGVETKFKEITGKDLQKYYRPPQGKYSVNNLKQANELGYKTIFWSLAYVDWYRDKQPTKEQAFDKLLTRIHPGAIVLLHSTSKTNSEILDELLSKWEALGYTFGTLNELSGK
ncbi:delta-lactam-biosynthetic de-N-acetylase [Caproiciproducens galactitolivorans]|uniref:Delta-lactam-biosynthetic de-N-acetylase n=1 Tax=Caproiciproducens galactitolivorans TaxID=642589 RepID=A0ABT4BQC3_9FIRM|nr:delta-lactam-biosynthetic de-N-acetylase [Caproiciproducens galactitolivorans]MCY1713092.1 delta-lactam-biosynthetic de-N-acetylase [Caproiciproducens galactitolivorans]